MNHSRKPYRRRHLLRASGQHQATLLSAATSLRAANGFTRTTTKQIAQAVGISDALFFKHFPTKHALYTEILPGKAHYSGLRKAIEAAAEKRDDRRLLTSLASYRIRKGTDPTLLRPLLFQYPGRS